ncbi:MAG: isocitrate/isopropylmalate dehydrogenase family protein [Gemmataceae bacterium]|nr:isocitrate/isopropylmalate dehydrogenase family protein [Gemmataceae bacterium]
MTSVVMIAGDGIGPEVMAATRQIVHAAGARIDWIEAHAGLDAVEKFGEPLPDATLDLVRKHRVALKGPCTTPIGKGFRSINVRLRQGLELFASIRPVQTLPGIKVPYDNVDLIVVRENTEGLYAGMEHVVVPGVVESLRLVTRDAAERILKYAFELARHQGRRKVTVVHKASVLPLSDGMFLKIAQQIADDYPFLEYEQQTIDHVALDLALDPTPYDVMVMENLFGDVMSDLCAGLVGGLGVVPGANIGKRYAVFEAVHGSAPDIAGKGLANPIALLRSAAMMLDHIGQRVIAQRVEQSVRRTLQAGVGLTRDLGSEGNTMTITAQLIANL